jgi:hypothetical protein
MHITGFGCMVSTITCSYAPSLLQVCGCSIGVHVVQLYSMGSLAEKSKKEIHTVDVDSARFLEGVEFNPHVWLTSLAKTYSAWFSEAGLLLDLQQDNQ